MPLDLLDVDGGSFGVVCTPVTCVGDSMLNSSSSLACCCCNSAPVTVLSSWFVGVWKDSVTSVFVTVSSLFSS